MVVRAKGSRARRLERVERGEGWAGPTFRLALLGTSYGQAIEDWRWSSLWRRISGTAEQKQLLSTWPVPYPRNWCELVNEPQAEVEAIRRCVERGQPYGGEAWVRRTAEQLGLESTLRAPDRPRKAAGNQ